MQLSAAISEGRPGQGAVERFSTSGVQACRKLAYWNELNNETFTGLTVSAADEDNYSADLERLHIGSIKVVKARSSASQIIHSDNHTGRAPSDRHFIMHLQAHGQSVNQQAGRSVDLAPGDMTLCETGRPYELSFSNPASFLVLVLPAAEMLRRLPNLEDAVSLRISQQAGRTGILRSLIKAIWADSLHLPTQGRNDDLQSLVLDAVAACLAPAFPRLECRALSRVERDVLALADENFGKIDYGVQNIAEQTGLSVRSVQKIFASNGTTVSSYILRKRLEWAAQALAETDEKVICVAYEAGFNDHAYFTRSFRSAFGTTPSEYRRAKNHSIHGCASLNG